MSIWINDSGKKKKKRYLETKHMLSKRKGRMIKLCLYHRLEGYSFGINTHFPLIKEICASPPL